MNISAATDSAAEILREAGVPEFRREASSLLAFVLQKDSVSLVAHPEYELTSDEAASFGAVVQRRANHEPFQYIVGRQEFYGLEFEVTPDVLIPRPETEILVESAIEILSELENPRFCEIGVGSGCISVSILHNSASASAVGVDISRAALEAAARNAVKHGAGDRLTLREADVFDGLSGTFDLIVSNPPYVPDGQLESLQAEVRQFEPRVALSGGDDGLVVIKRIIAGAPEFLRAEGFMLIEIGFDQAEIVKELLNPAMWSSVEFLADLQGIPRIVKARLRN